MKKLRPSSVGRLSVFQRRMITAVAPSIGKSIIPDDAGKKSLYEYVEADFPHEITGFKKMFQHTTLFYPNKVPIYADGLHKWRPGSGFLRCWHQAMGESTLSRFTQNSKLIIVDGPRYSGKTKLAKDLAEGLNMRYFPKVTNTWIQEITMDGEVLPDWKWNLYTDIQKFYEDPKSACGHSGRLQYITMLNSFRQYIMNALHLLGTGQGVVMERSVFNNWADKDALLDVGYITPEFHAWLGVKERAMFDRLVPPHMLIYLDVSPEETYRRIQEFGTAYEKKVDKKYLESVDKFNKLHLPELNKAHNTVTVQYDWNKFGTSEQVLDDFELLDFTDVKEWNRLGDDDWLIVRMAYQKRLDIEYLWIANKGKGTPETAFSPDYIEQYHKEYRERMKRKDWFPIGMYDGDK